MRIFMTGGAGFLGRAIMRRVPQLMSEPVTFTVYSRDAGKQVRSRREFPDAQYVLGDVRDLHQLEAGMAGHDVVIHAAAMKYVPEGERNVSESIAVNVTGSENICAAALRLGIERVVGISTDKACRPVNVYGMTKLLMERLFQEADTISPGTQFNLVRYGNVVSSTGSVIPLFRHQAREGIITLTNPDMTRFWLPIDEAVDLVWDALREREGGTVLIPRLQSLSMGDVAVACAILEGQSAFSQTIIGQRFGEKVHEELLTSVEALYTEGAPETSGGLTMRMFPVTGGIRAGHMTEPYSSHAPDVPLSIDEMVQWIREAPAE